MSTAEQSHEKPSVPWHIKLRQIFFNVVMWATIPLAIVQLIFWIFLTVKSGPDSIWTNLGNFFSNQLNFLELLITVLVAGSAAIGKGFVERERFVKAASNIPAQAETLNSLAQQINRSAEQIEKHELTTTKRGLSLIGEFLKLSTSEARTDDMHARASHTAMEAVACNLRNWENQIRSHYRGGKGDRFLTEVWIRSQGAYFLEEGFDVGKKTLATNGRNLCFVILAALDALMELGVADRRTVHYTAVTPVNPKDWYNWPHGRNGKEYYESDFIGDYYRVLREIVHAHTGSLKHDRYILCMNSNTPSHKLTQRLGWQLDSSGDLRRNLRGSIIPCSFPRLSEQIKNLGSPLSDYIEVLAVKYNISVHGPLRTFIPLDCWNHSRTSTALTQNAKKKLQEASREYFRTTGQEILNKLSASMSNVPPPIEGILKKVCDEAQELLSLRNLNPQNRQKVINWLRDSHGAEAHLAGFVKEDGKDLLQRLRSHLLRNLDYYHFEPERSCLYEVFASQIQSSAEDCFVAALEDNNVDEWFVNNEVESEFHLFGFEDENGILEWKLCVTATLKYPFDVTQLRLEDDPDKIKRYSNTIENLKTISSTMTEFATQGNQGA